MIQLKEITNYLESLAPLSTQESYDNSGLIVGNENLEVKGVLISLDCIESIVDEAIETGCNLIVSHHPIVFTGLKKLNGSDYIQRTIIKAIKNDIAIYAIHTNFDNYKYGVNFEIGKRIGLKNLKILAPKSKVLNKIVCFVPPSHMESVSTDMFKAGAGRIGDYSECSFIGKGIGTYKPGESTNPYEGEINQKSNVVEERLEVLVSSHKINQVLTAMQNSHPYEEVAFDIYPILNQNQNEGSGMIGVLEEPVDEIDFLKELKSKFNCGVIRHTSLLNKKIESVAYCGGSGSFLLSNAKAAGADIFITGDYKYHDFFDADNQLLIADIGHFESEQFTSNRISELLKKKFPKFAVRITEVITNPINYI